MKKNIFASILLLSIFSHNSYADQNTNSSCPQLAGSYDVVNCTDSEKDDPSYVYVNFWSNGEFMSLKSGDKIVVSQSSCDGITVDKNDGETKSISFIKNDYKGEDVEFDMDSSSIEVVNGGYFSDMDCESHPHNPIPGCFIGAKSSKKLEKYSNGSIRYSSSSTLLALPFYIIPIIGNEKQGCTFIRNLK